MDQAGTIAAFRCLCIKMICRYIFFTHFCTTHIKFCFNILYLSPFTSQICGPPKCSDFDNCISCLFTIVGTSLVQQDRGACLYLCNDIEVITTTDSSLVATLQGNSTLQCSDYRSSERCEGPVYYVQGRGKRLYVVEGSLSE